jgi:(p)ppGpp synthase/HD superfamily hydrolase
LDYNKRRQNTLNEKLQLAINTAIKYHEGQNDLGGTPYINHPVYLALQFKDQDCQIVALLHDIVEDTIMTINDVKRLFGNDIANSVDCITKRKNKETYKEYLMRVKSDKIALKVKIEDINHNLSNSRNCPKDKLDYLNNKYSKALKYLIEK